MRRYQLERDRTQNRFPLLLVALALSGRFPAAMPATGWYHEEKATQSVEPLPYIASSIALCLHRNSAFGNYPTTPS
jgi:hypothetical protein